MKQGLMVPPAVRRGSVGSRQAPRRPVETPWRAQGVRTSIVHRYGTVERSGEPCRVPSCQNSCSDGNPLEPDMARQDLTSPDG